MTRKKVAIVTRKMIVGGVEKALLGMLKKIDFNSIEIDLYLEKIGGELFNSIPKEVNIIEIPTLKSDKSYMLKHPIRGAQIIYNKIKIKGEQNYLRQCEIASRCLPTVERKYDMAISYHAPNTIPVFYTINNIKSDKKVIWLHGDLETNGAVCQLAYKYYKLYDKVFAVSKKIKDSFDCNYCDLEYKSELFYNYIDKDKLISLSHEGKIFSDFNSTQNLLTIGRLDYQKGYDLAIEAFFKLKSEGYKVKWYICGEGNYRKEIEKLISKYNLQDEFILLGNQMNPYGYLKSCDIYVQPSRTEGYCTTTNEARILLKPVVTTNVSGADEQFENNKTGIIVPITSDGIYEGIKLLINNRDLKSELIRNLKDVSVDNEENIDKLIKILY